MAETAPDPCAAQPPNSQGVYLYCLARPTIAGRIEGPGLDDRAEVTTLTVGEVAAVFSRVSLAAFIGSAGDTHLRDAAWIIPRAREHARVVVEVMQLSPVLPARFGTVLSSPALLKRLLARHAEQIRAFLERMAGREEWSVKVFLDVAKAKAWLRKSQTVPVDAPMPDTVSPGLHYIQDEQAAVHARQRLDEWSRRTANEAGNMLAVHAVEVCALRPQPQGTSDNTGRMILNRALLVWKNHVAELYRRASEIEAQYADQGLTVNVSGPWPPYSFCPPVLDVG